MQFLSFDFQTLALKGFSAFLYGFFLIETQQIKKSLW